MMDDIEKIDTGGSTEDGRPDAMFGDDDIKEVIHICGLVFN